jgi:uncharacterized protein
MASNSPSPGEGGFVPGLLRRLTLAAARFPVTMLLLCCLLSGAACWYTAQRLEFRTSRSDLIDPGTEYHRRWISYTKEFGDVTEDIVVVVECDNTETIHAVLDDLGPRLEREPKLFKNVLYRIDLARLREKALQYSSPEQLSGIIDQLEEFGPVLRGRWNLFTLKQLFFNLRLKLESAASEPPEIAPMLTEPLLHQIALISTSLARYVHDQRDYLSPWAGLASQDMAAIGQNFHVRYLTNPKGTQGFLKVQPVAASNDFSGGSPAIDRLREILRDTERRYPSTRLGLTGIPVLESDEMRDSQTAMLWASIISFAGVGVLLVMGFQGFRYPLIANAVLLVGMACSFGYTTLAVGHLNILSVSFAAMLIGIGIDYSTVYLVRYRELRLEGRDVTAALAETAATSGAGILTAAISSTVAFFCAMFTDFAGVAELGIIAGGGILICTAGSFVLLPSLLALVDRRQKQLSVPNPFESRMLRLVTSRYPIPVVLLAGLGIGWLSLYAGNVKYDYNLLHLQAEGLESVDVQKRIFEQSDGSLLFAVSLADSPREVRELKRKFEALPSVHHVEELAAVFPQYDPEETRLLVQAIHAQLANLPSRVREPGDIEPDTIGRQAEELESTLAKIASPAAAQAHEQLAAFLDRLGTYPVERQVQLLRDYQYQITADLLTLLRGLESLSNPEPVSTADLVPSLVSRFVSPRGKWLLQVYPKNQIWDPEPLSKFIADVRSVDPEITGTPLQTFEASRDIKHSYELAGIYALIAVCVLLMLDFRSIPDSLLALLPPGLGMAAMFGIMGLLGIDRNPANLIVLPLIVGLGVDGGVHVLHDYRTQRGLYQPSASTINAIFMNSTTTMVGFGSMMIAAHRGLYSLGLVVTLGVGTCMVVSIVLLPALLTIISRMSHGSATPRTMPAASEEADGTFPQPPHSVHAVSGAAEESHFGK